MALEYRTTNSRCEIIVDGTTFISAFGTKKTGVWDTTLNKWASPPADIPDIELTLTQLKNRVNALT